MILPKDNCLKIKDKKCRGIGNLNLSFINILKGIKDNWRTNTTKLTNRGNILYKLQKTGNSYIIWKNIKLWHIIGKIIKQKLNKTWITSHYYKYAYAYLNNYYIKTITVYCIK